MLASASPRRRQLLAQLGVQFEVRPAALDETALPDEDARAHVERLAIAKATAVAAPAEVVLAADTTVELDGRIFGKPTDTDHALDMLRLLRGPPRRPRGSRGAGRRPPPRVEDRAGEHRRAHGVQGVLERGDHPEVAAAAAQRPEQVRVLLRAGVHQLPVRRDEVGADQVVGGQAAAPDQPAESAAEGEPGDPGRRHHPPGHGEPEGLCLVVEVAPQAAGLRDDAAGRRIDSDALHGREVQDDPAVGGREARDAVAATAYRERKSLAAGETPPRAPHRTRRRSG